MPYKDPEAKRAWRKRNTHKQRIYKAKWKAKTGIEQARIERRRERAERKAHAEQEKQRRREAYLELLAYYKTPEYKEIRKQRERERSREKRLRIKAAPIRLARYRAQRRILYARKRADPIWREKRREHYRRSRVRKANLQKAKQLEALHHAMGAPLKLPPIILFDPLIGTPNEIRELLKIDRLWYKRCYSAYRCNRYWGDVNAYQYPLPGGRKSDRLLRKVRELNSVPTPTYPKRSHAYRENAALRNARWTARHHKRILAARRLRRAVRYPYPDWNLTLGTP